MTNDDLSERLDTSDEWIRQRVGILERRFAAPEETLIDLGAEAALRALADAAVHAWQIDAVVVATSSLVDPIPNAAARLAHRIGAGSAGAFDLNAGCASFCYGLAVASDLVRAGSAGYVLVVGAEKLTDVVDPDDRRTAIIFGDGAGAVVVGPSEEIGIGPAAWNHAGELSDALRMSDDRFVVLQGQVVFRWAVDHLPRLASRAVELAGISVGDVDALVMHQANLRIVRAVEERLRSEGLRGDVVVADDIRNSGNTSSASVPLALDALRRDGLVRSGDIVLTVAVGAGMTGAGQVVVCP